MFIENTRKSIRARSVQRPNWIKGIFISRVVGIEISWYFCSSVMSGYIRLGGVSMTSGWSVRMVWKKEMSEFLIPSLSRIHKPSRDWRHVMLFLLHRHIVVAWEYLVFWSLYRIYLSQDFYFHKIYSSLRRCSLWSCRDSSVEMELEVVGHVRRRLISSVTRWIWVCKLPKVCLFKWSRFFLVSWSQPGISLVSMWGKEWC